MVPPFPKSVCNNLTIYHSSLHLPKHTRSHVFKDKVVSVFRLTSNPQWIIHQNYIYKLLKCLNLENLNHIIKLLVVVLYNF